MDKKPTTISKLIHWTFRVGLGALFVLAGVIKILNPARFAGEINDYMLVPQVAVQWLSFYLPWLEIITGTILLLSWRKFYQGSLGIVWGLLAIFMLALGIAWLRGLDVGCGCFGITEERGKFTWWLSRDGVLLTATGWLFREKHGNYCCGSSV